MPGTVFWDVDTQVDFMLPTGSLPVPGAEALLPNLGRLTEAARAAGVTIVHTADLHSRFFPYYFAPGQIDKGLGLVPRPGQSTAVVGGIGRVAERDFSGAVSIRGPLVRPVGARSRGDPAR